MLSASTVLRLSLSIPLLSLSSCGFRTSSESDAMTVNPSDVTGSWCSSREPVDASEGGSLCVNLAAETGSIDAFGLASGSELVVTGSQGDVVTFDIDDADLSAQLDREMVANGFDVTGVWADGEELQLVVDQS